MAGFGCHLIGFDLHRSPEFEGIGGRYVDADGIEDADVISLHCPLTPDTYHIVNAQTLARVKKGALLINTSRGGLVDTEAAIDALKSGRLGGIAIDVYEQEAGLFFKDLSSTVIPDDVIQRVVSLPNVILTGHHSSREPASDTEIRRPFSPRHETARQLHRRAIERIAMGWHLVASLEHKLVHHVEDLGVRLDHTGGVKVPANFAKHVAVLGIKGAPGKRIGIGL